MIRGRVPRPLVAALAAAALLGTTVLVSGPASAAAPAAAQAPAAGPAGTWTVTWTSQLAPGSSSKGSGWMPTISGNGQAVTFSSASRLSGAGAFTLPRTYVRRAGSPAPLRLATLPGGTSGNDGDLSSCTNCDRESDLSGDGRTAVFVSRSSNLTPGDTNGAADIFLRDFATGAVTLVSHAPDGSPADSASDVPQISTDGRWVLFVSSASNLVPGTAAGQSSWYLYDTTTLRTRSLGTLGSTYRLQLAGDGSAVVFDTDRALLPSDTDGHSDVYLLDLTTDAVSLVSVTTTGSAAGGYGPSVSDDAHTVAYHSYTRIKPGRLLVRNLSSGRTVAVPLTAGTYLQQAQVSGDGRRLAVSHTDLDGSHVLTDVMDLSGTVLYRSGPNGANRMYPSLDRDGSCVSYATTFPEVAADQNSGLDVYTACEH